MAAWRRFDRFYPAHKKSNAESTLALDQRTENDYENEND
jgi:hypothetical protein